MIIPYALKRNQRLLEREPREAPGTARDSSGTDAPADAPAPSSADGLTRGKRKYFLEVEIRVPAAKRDQFADEGHRLLDTFRAVKLIPTSSAWYTGTGPIFVVNYWDMGDDANVLLEAELALPDVPGFNAFNALVGSETKNIAIPIAADEQVKIPDELREPCAEGYNLLPAAKFRYLRVTCEVATPNLPEFVARTDGYMQGFTEQQKWFLGDTYLRITGGEGVVSQVWIIPVDDAPLVAEKLLGARWLRSEVLKAEPSFQILRATHSDPNMEFSSDG